MTSDVSRLPGFRDPTRPVSRSIRVNPLEPIGTIAVPCRDHMAAETAVSLITAAGAGWMLQPGQRVAIHVTQGGILTMQRNEAVQRMQGEWLFFIDDDMVFQPQDIATILEDAAEYDLEMVGGLCFRRHPPFQPTLYVRESPDAGAYNFMERWDEGLVEVDATGLAFLFIRKSVFQKISHVHGQEFPSYDERIAGDPPEFFTWQGRLGEDLRFCQEAKALGVRIFVDTRVKIGHVGERIVTGEDYLAQIALRAPEREAERRVINERFGLPTLTAREAKEQLGW